MSWIGKKQILIWIACLLGTQVAQGQTTGRIAGTVKDPSGAVVPGAAVKCTHDRSGEERKVLTDAAGNYSAPLLPPGNYVSVSAKGFATQTFGFRLLESLPSFESCSVSAACGFADARNRADVDQQTQRCSPDSANAQESETVVPRKVPTRLERSATSGL